MYCSCLDYYFELFGHLTFLTMLPQMPCLKEKESIILAEDDSLNKIYHVIQ